MIQQDAFFSFLVYLEGGRGFSIEYQIFDFLLLTSTYARNVSSKVWHLSGRSIHSVVLNSSFNRSIIFVTPSLLSLLEDKESIFTLLFLSIGSGWLGVFGRGLERFLFSKFSSLSLSFSFSSSASSSSSRRGNHPHHRHSRTVPPTPKALPTLPHSRKHEPPLKLSLLSL